MEKNEYYSFLRNLVKDYFNGNVKERLALQPPKKKNLSIVLNGPSVNWTIQYLNKDESDVMMANYAPLTPLFKELNPQYICFADTLLGKYTKKNLMLRDELKEAGDKLTIFLPHYLKDKKIYSDKKLNIKYVYSPKEIRRYDIFSYRFLEENIAAPVYYNVAVMCMYVGIQLGYKRINLYGADEDFMKELSVDKQNRVMRNSVHYYGKETFCENTYHKFDMEAMMYMGYMTFRELKKLKRYAIKEKVKIVNMSDVSWIDFFERFERE